MTTPWTHEPDDPDSGPQAGDGSDEAAVAVDEQVEVPDPPVTGDPAVDAATSSVAAAAAAPLEEQVQAFDDAHRALQDRLADVDG